MISPSSRGQVQLELIVVVVVLFSLAMVGFFLYQPFHDIGVKIQATNAFGNSTQSTVNNIESFPAIWDAGLMMLFLVVWVFLLIGAYYLNTHPIFFVVMLIVMIVMFLVMIFIGNAYDDVATRVTVRASFPMIDWLMTHILEAMVLVSATVLVVLFSRQNAGGGL